MFDLKPIAKTSIPRALEKAERYRLLNEPQEAESICLDVLAVEPANQEALVCLLLALTDEFGASATGSLEQAKQIVPRLSGSYQQSYYAGIISERFARQHLNSNHTGAGLVAYQYLCDAMKCYDQAQALAPAGNDDATLRRNTCVRMIQQYALEAPQSDEREPPFE